MKLSTSRPSAVAIKSRVASGFAAYRFGSSCLEAMGLAASLLAAALLAAALYGLRRFAASLFAASLPRVVVSSASIAKIANAHATLFLIGRPFILFIVVFSSCNQHSFGFSHVSTQL